MTRPVRSFLCVGWLLLAASPASPAAPGFATSVQPFLNRNCLGCHSGTSAAGGLDVSRFLNASSLRSDPERWERMLERVKGGEMPPKGVPKPPAADRTRFQTWVEAELERQERQAKPDPGRVTARRLNRAEYNYTVRDLLGVRFRPESLRPFSGYLSREARPTSSATATLLSPRWSGQSSH